MQLVVFIKPVIDNTRLRSEQLAAGPMPHDGVDWMLNPYDEYALETALRLRESLGETGADPACVRVSVLALGAASTRECLKKAIAVGADEAFLLCDPLFLQADNAAVARALAAGVRTLAPEARLILCGQQSLDLAQGVVGLMTAQALAFASVTACKSAAWQNAQTLRLVRDARAAQETVDVSLPALAAFGKCAYELRTANIKGVMRANKTPVTLVSAADVGLSDATPGVASLPRPMLRPRAPKTPGVLIPATDDPQAAVLQLLERLTREKIL